MLRKAFSPPTLLLATMLLFSCVAVAQLITLHHFASPANGRTPNPGLLADKFGNLYGATRYGGNSDYGIIFELSPPASGGAWTETVVYTFAGDPDGRSPLGDLIANEDGNLYGTTSYGGSSGQWGTVFELSPPSSPGGAWTEQILYRFQGAPDGQFPSSGLIRDAVGNLYGETSGGGSCTNYGGSGVVYELSPPSAPGGAWTEQVLYSFQKNCGGTDGHIPTGGLMFGSGGSLIGVTQYGGTSTANAGVVFRLKPPSGGQTLWTERALHNFASGSDGNNPIAGVIADASGNLFGTTAGGGEKQGCCGLIYELLRPTVVGGPWTENVIYSFSGGSDGASPDGRLIFDSKGNFYGVADNGGTGTCGGEYAGGCGVVFKLAPPSAAGGAWTETVLHTFTDAIGDEANPVGSLTFGKDRRLYGMTDGWGSKPPESGTVFKVIP